MSVCIRRNRCSVNAWLASMRRFNTFSSSTSGSMGDRLLYALLSFGVCFLDLSLRVFTHAFRFKVRKVTSHLEVAVRLHQPIARIQYDNASSQRHHVRRTHCVLKRLPDHVDPKLFAAVAVLSHCAARCSCDCLRLE